VITSPVLGSPIGVPEGDHDRAGDDDERDGVTGRVVAVAVGRQGGFDRQAPSRRRICAAIPFRGSR
jgi:hypothetical protein